MVSVYALARTEMGAEDGPLIQWSFSHQAGQVDACVFHRL